MFNGPVQGGNTNFVSFGDNPGVTQLRKLGHYGEDGLINSGWKIVGVVESVDSERNPELYGLFVRQPDEAIAAAQKERVEAEKAKTAAETKAREAQKVSDDLSRRNAELIERCEELRVENEAMRADLAAPVDAA